MLQNMTPVLVLLAILVGIAFALKWAKRRMPGAAGHNGPPMQLLSSLSLGPQLRVVTLQVGQGEDRVCLVLGVSASNVNTLHQMPMPADLPDTPIETPASGFAARLAQLTQPRKDANAG